MNEIDYRRTSRGLDARIQALEQSLRALEQRITALDHDYGAPFNTREECAAGTCGYGTKYLVAGPAVLSHECFHAAEEKAARHYETCPAPLGIQCWHCDQWTRKLRS